MNNYKKPINRDTIKRGLAIFESMGIKDTVVENRVSFQYVEAGKDNCVYAIVKEGASFVVKKAKLSENVHHTDFEYLRGQTHKHLSRHKSLAEAMKDLKSTIMSISMLNENRYNKIETNVVIDYSLVKPIVETVQVIDEIEIIDEVEVDIFAEEDESLNNVDSLVGDIDEALNKMESILSSIDVSDSEKKK